MISFLKIYYTQITHRFSCICDVLLSTASVVASISFWQLKWYEPL